MGKYKYSSLDEYDTFEDYEEARKFYEGAENQYINEYIERYYEEKYETDN